MIAVGQSTHLSPERTPSPASRLLQGIGVHIRNEGTRAPKSQVGFQAASAAVAVVAPSRGRVEVLRSGHRGRDAAVAAPGHGWPMAAGPRSRTGARACRALASHRTKGAKALWLLSRFSKVTRRKGETIRSRYHSNGYAPLKNHTTKGPAMIQLHSESDQAVAVVRPRAVNATHSR
jgi:hypothetical protein